MRHRRSGFFNLHIVFILSIVLSFLFIDKPVAVWMHKHVTGTWILGFSKFIGNILSPEHLAYFAVVIAMISCFYIVRDYRDAAKPYAFITLSFFTASIIAFGIKVFFARYRPELMFVDNLYGFSFFSAKHSCNSFPSGHAVANFAIAIALFHLIREKSVCYAILIVAIIVAVSRIICTAHYCSDVIAGIYLAILVNNYIDSIYLRR